MADFTVSGLDDLVSAFKASADVPTPVKEKILRSMGEVAASAQAKSAVDMGVFDSKSSVHIAQHIKINKPKVTDSGGTLEITFEGKRKRGKKSTRNAEIAFINEFGKRGQPARPFIKTANEQNANKINQAGQNALNEWLDSIN